MQIKFAIFFKTWNWCKSPMECKSHRINTLITLLYIYYVEISSQTGLYNHTISSLLFYLTQLSSRTDRYFSTTIIYPVKIGKDSYDIQKEENNCRSLGGKVQLISLERWWRARRSSNGITKGPSRVVQVCKQKPVVNVIVPRDLSAEAGQALTDLWCRVINRMSPTDGIQSNIDSYPPPLLSHHLLPFVFPQLALRHANIVPFHSATRESIRSIHF